MHRQDQCRTLTRRFEENTAGGTQRAGPNRALVHQIGRQPLPGTRRKDDIDRALCSFMTTVFWKATSAGRRTVSLRD